MAQNQSGDTAIYTDCSSTGIADEPMEKDSLQHLI